ncbi:hypothetical protein Btru_025601 [Bulinus truncatus]|nr:hypothetical protein Btru_025601 [Bulinus truncatus]
MPLGAIQSAFYQKCFLYTEIKIMNSKGLKDSSVTNNTFFPTSCHLLLDCYSCYFSLIGACPVICCWNATVVTSHLLEPVLSSVVGMLQLLLLTYWSRSCHLLLECYSCYFSLIGAGPVICCWTATVVTSHLLEPVLSSVVGLLQLLLLTYWSRSCHLLLDCYSCYFSLIGAGPVICCWTATVVTSHLLEPVLSSVKSDCHSCYFSLIGAGPVICCWTATVVTSHLLEPVLSSVVGLLQLLLLTYWSRFDSMNTIWGPQLYCDFTTYVPVSIAIFSVIIGWSTFTIWPAMLAMGKGGVLMILYVVMCIFSLAAATASALLQRFGYDNTCARSSSSQIGSYSVSCEELETINISELSAKSYVQDIHRSMLLAQVNTSLE